MTDRYIVSAFYTFYHFKEVVVHYTTSADDRPLIFIASHGYGEAAADVKRHVGLEATVEHISEGAMALLIQQEQERHPDRQLGREVLDYLHEVSV